MSNLQTIRLDKIKEPAINEKMNTDAVLAPIEQEGYVRSVIRARYPEFTEDEIDQLEQVL